MSHLEKIEETVTIGKELPPAEAVPDSLIGTVFAQKYEVKEMIGRGGMSVVYKARHTVMDRTVALKVLHSHLSKDDIALRRFKQEAQAASTLNFPGIVATHDCGECNGTPYLVMDFVEGDSLSRLLQTEGPLSTERFLSIMEQVAAALAHAHKKGIVHRDLKPSNIMIARSGDKEEAKIVDFGIAKVLTGTGENAHQLTQTGEIFGSPYYMSPEQCAGTQVDARSDIYSLGCVMYEMLSGSVPFKCETVFETINKHLNSPPPPLVANQIESDIRQKIELLLLKAMAKSPDDRFQSMDELGADLRSLRLKSRAGVLGYLGGVWDLASAKRRAERKNRLPLMVVTLTTVSCLSVASVLLLLGGLNTRDTEIKRLEQSRRILSEICLAQGDFDMVGDAAKPYFTSIYLYPDKTERLRKAYEKTRLATISRLDQVEKALAPDKVLLKRFRKKWKPMLIKYPKYFGDCMEAMTQEGGQAEMTFTNLTKSLSMMEVSAKCSAVLIEMTQQAREVEKEQMGQFRSTEQWIAYVAFLCLALNGAVVASLFVYFARGTPQKLRKLSQQAAQLSKQRGLMQASPNQDEVADLDLVLQELATALTESEEREKLLRQQLKEQTDPPDDAKRRLAKSSAEENSEPYRVVNTDFVE